MDGPILVALAAAIGAAVWFAARPPALFLIRIRDGRAQTVRGTTTAAFQAAIAELCQQYGIKTGEIRGVARGTRIALCFSRNLPAGFQQQLRNWWVMSGWSAGPRRA